VKIVGDGLRIRKLLWSKIEERSVVKKSVTSDSG